MGNPIFSELLILFLLILNCSRIFFLKYGKIDSLAVLAPLALFFSLLHFFAWGVDVCSALIFVITIFAFATNFRALLRFMSGLYVDYYSGMFKLGAGIVLVLSFAMVGGLWYFRPLVSKAQDFSVAQKKVRLSGDFTNGFRRSFPFEFSNAEISAFYPDSYDSAGGLQPIVLLAEKNASPLDYEPLCLMLAQRGYVVYVGDFYARDGKWCHNLMDVRYFRRGWLLLERIFRTAGFESQKEFYSFNMLKECRAMTDFVRADVLYEKPEERSGAAEAENTAAATAETVALDVAQQEKELVSEPIFVVGDWMSRTALREFYDENKNFLCGYTNLTDYEEYRTPGYGFIQQTNPLAAFALGAFQREAVQDTAAIEAVAQKIQEAVPPRVYPAPVPVRSVQDAAQNEGAEDGLNEQTDDAGDSSFTEAKE